MNKLQKTMEKSRFDWCIVGCIVRKPLYTLVKISLLNWCIVCMVGV